MTPTTRRSLLLSLAFFLLFVASASATSITLEQAATCNCVNITADITKPDVQQNDAYWWAPYWRDVVTLAVDGAHLYFIWFW